MYLHGNLFEILYNYELILQTRPVEPRVSRFCNDFLSLPKYRFNRIAHIPIFEEKKLYSFFRVEYVNSFREEVIYFSLLWREESSTLITFLGSMLPHCMVLSFPSLCLVYKSEKIQPCHRGYTSTYKCHQ